MDTFEYTITHQVIKLSKKFSRNVPHRYFTKTKPTEQNNVKLPPYWQGWSPMLNNIKLPPYWLGWSPVLTSWLCAMAMSWTLLQFIGMESYVLAGSQPYTFSWFSAAAYKHAPSGWKHILLQNNGKQCLHRKVF